jgi:hypothetical protein
MTVEPSEFHFEEYKQLKKQLLSLLDRVSTIIQYVLGGIAAIYTWLITHSMSNSVAMWIPVGLSFFGMVMVITISTRIGAIRQYLNILEDYLHNSKKTLSTNLVEVPLGVVSGWEQFRAQSSLKAFWEVITISLFGLVFLVTVGLAVGWPVRLSS